MEIDRDGLDTFVRRYGKYDSIIGETNRMEFLEQKFKEHEDNINRITVITSN